MLSIESNPFCHSSEDTRLCRVEGGMTLMPVQRNKNLGSQPFIERLPCKLLLPIDNLTSFRKGWQSFSQQCMQKVEGVLYPNFPSKCQSELAKTMNDDYMGSKVGKCWKGLKVLTLISNVLILCAWLEVEGK